MHRRMSARGKKAWKDLRALTFFPCLPACTSPDLGGEAGDDRGVRVGCLDTNKGSTCGRGLRLGSRVGGPWELVHGTVRQRWQLDLENSDAVKQNCRVRFGAKN